jgi:hypothetical protein
MEQNTIDTAKAPSAERRVWEAPLLTVVLPVDQTRGGAIKFTYESGYQKTS